MAKRPPQRTIPRKTADGGDLPFRAVEAAGDGAQDGAAPSPADTPRGDAAEASRFAGNRGEFLAFLGELRGQGSLSVADEAAILREYDGLLAQLRTERAELEREYRERVARDGRDQTDAWLKQSAEALGRRQGERMRQLLVTIPAFSREQAAAG